MKIELPVPRFCDQIGRLRDADGHYMEINVKSLAYLVDMEETDGKAKYEDVERVDLKELFDEDVGEVNPFNHKYVIVVFESADDKEFMLVLTTEEWNFIYEDWSDGDRLRDFIASMHPDAITVKGAEEHITGWTDNVPGEDYSIELDGFGLYPEVESRLVFSLLFKELMEETTEENTEESNENFFGNFFNEDTISNILSRKTVQFNQDLLEGEKIISDIKKIDTVNRYLEAIDITSPSKDLRVFDSVIQDYRRLMVFANPNFHPYRELEMPIATGGDDTVLYDKEREKDTIQRFRNVYGDKVKNGAVTSWFNKYPTQETVFCRPVDDPDAILEEGSKSLMTIRFGETTTEEEAKIIASAINGLVETYGTEALDYQVCVTDSKHTYFMALKHLVYLMQAFIGEEEVSFNSLVELQAILILEGKFNAYFCITEGEKDEIWAIYEAYIRGEIKDPTPTMMSSKELMDDDTRRKMLDRNYIPVPAVDLSVVREPRTAELINMGIRWFDCLGKTKNDILRHPINIAELEALEENHTRFVRATFNIKAMDRKEFVRTLTNAVLKTKTETKQIPEPVTEAVPSFISEEKETIEPEQYYSVPRTEQARKHVTLEQAASYVYKNIALQLLEGRAPEGAETIYLDASTNSTDIVLYNLDGTLTAVPSEPSDQSVLLITLDGQLLKVAPPVATEYVTKLKKGEYDTDIYDIIPKWSYMEVDKWMQNNADSGWDKNLRNFKKEQQDLKAIRYSNGGTKYLPTKIISFGELVELGIGIIQERDNVHTQQQQAYQPQQQQYGGHTANRPYRNPGWSNQPNYMNETHMEREANTPYVDKSKMDSYMKVTKDHIAGGPAYTRMDNRFNSHPATQQQDQPYRGKPASSLKYMSEIADMELHNRPPRQPSMGMMPNQWPPQQAPQWPPQHTQQAWQQPQCPQQQWPPQQPQQQQWGTVQQPWQQPTHTAPQYQQQQSPQPAIFSNIPRTPQYMNMQQRPPQYQPNMTGAYNSPLYY